MKEYQIQKRMRKLHQEYGETDMRKRQNVDIMMPVEFTILSFSNENPDFNSRQVRRLLEAAAITLDDRIQKTDSGIRDSLPEVHQLLLNELLDSISVDDADGIRFINRLIASVDLHIEIEGRDGYLKYLHRMFGYGPVHSVTMAEN